MDHLHEHTSSHVDEPIEVLLQHILGHSVGDVLYLIPFLFATYLAMEWLEHKTGAGTQETIRRAGAAGPVLGALLGIIPQCGFSAAAAALYAGRVVTLGTLFAVFLCTSDEMIPIFIAERVPFETIAKVLGAKVIIGMLMGFIVDAVLRILRRDGQKLRIHELCKQDQCACNHDCATCTANPESVYEHHADRDHHEECTESVCGHSHDHHHDGENECAHAREAHHEHDNHAHHAHEREVHAQPCHEFACEEDLCRGHDHDHSHDGGWAGIAKSALMHTVKVALFVFAITILLNAALELIGQDAIAHFLESNSILAIFASALVGLIPNCAASVLIAQLYLEGMLSAGAMMAGLLVSAGVGLMVLVRSNRPSSQNLLIIAALYAMGVLWGLLIQMMGIVF